MKVYIVVELPKTEPPKLIGVFRKERAALDSLADAKHFCNIIEAELK